MYVYGASAAKGARAATAAELATARRRLEAMQDQNDELRAYLRKAITERNAAQKDAAEYEQRLIQMRAELDQIKEQQAAGPSLVRLQVEREQMQHRLAVINEENEALREQLDRAQAAARDFSRGVLVVLDADGAGEFPEEWTKEQCLVALERAEQTARLRRTAMKQGTRQTPRGRKGK